MIFHDDDCTRCGATEDLIRISELGRALCPRCFPEFLRGRVEGTVRRFRMIPKRAHVAVAVSAGSDSACLLHILAATRARLNFRLSAIHIHMGIGEYSDVCHEIVREQCSRSRVSLEVERVDSHGVRIDPIAGWPVCAVCGAVRRALMPRVALRIGANVLATGHTLDDQLQYMLRNVLSGRPVSPAPVLQPTGFAPLKVKPLIQVPDTASEEYVRLAGLPIAGEPCPRFVPDSHRFKDVFDLLEQRAPMGKMIFWQVLRKVMRPGDDEEDTCHDCPICGEPTTMHICPICRLREAQEHCDQTEAESAG